MGKPSQLLNPQKVAAVIQLIVRMSTVPGIELEEAQDPFDCMSGGREWTARAEDALIISAGLGAQKQRMRSNHNAHTLRLHAWTSYRGSNHEPSQEHSLMVHCCLK